MTEEKKPQTVNELLLSLATKESLAFVVLIVFAAIFYRDVRQSDQARLEIEKGRLVVEQERARSDRDRTDTFKALSDAIAGTEDVYESLILAIQASTKMENDLREDMVEALRNETLSRERLRQEFVRAMTEGAKQGPRRIGDTRSFNFDNPEDN